MKQQQFGHFIGGLYVQGQGSRQAHNPLGLAELSKRFAYIEAAGGDDDELVEAALEGAHLTFGQILKGFFKLSERLEVLGRVRGRLSDQKENMAQLICREVAKPIDLARREVDRALTTLDECLEIGPELLSDQSLKTKSRRGFENIQGTFERRPKGPLLAITPFNFPLNLVMHKIAPALLSGNPVILKPSEKGVVCALTLVDFFKAEGLPAGLLSCLSCAPSVTQNLIKDQRVAQISFTGSATVGWALHASRSTSWTLELGGNGLAYIDDSADIERAVQGALSSGFAYAGQVCIATQNVLVHESIFSDVVTRLKDTFPTAVVCGDPQQSGVMCGPVIDSDAKNRIDAALKRLSQRSGVECLSHTTQIEMPNYVVPQIVISKDAELWDTTEFKNEAFAPWITVSPVANLEAFTALANQQQSRLQLAIYSDNLRAALGAAQTLDFGGVVINDSPSLRFDSMPYGGQGRAGLGREGPRFAINEMTTTRSVLLRV